MTRTHLVVFFLLSLVVSACMGLRESGPNAVMQNASATFHHSHHPGGPGPGRARPSPNIIFILADDVGIADIGWSSEVNDIPTPSIDALAHAGVKLTNYYVQCLCTPSRASLLTGRYAVNTGLTNILVPAAVAGLPTEIPTLPEVLRDLGKYKSSMYGKWHLGFSKFKMTPTNRGFESFTGIYNLAHDPFSKQFYTEPWKAPVVIDWVTEFANGTIIHTAEPDHPTTVITRDAQNAIRNYAATQDEHPFFLYVAYTAAHSPLIPAPEHADHPSCKGIPHLWRRQYCELMVGFDEGVQKITETASKALADSTRETLIIVTSDNGGSPWFGGMNYPLRGSKTTPFEGGVKVAAVITELSSMRNTSFSAAPVAGRTYDHMFHVSDWMPTLISLAGIHAKVDGWDGIDLSGGLSLNLPPLPRNNGAIRSPKVRTEMLLELYSSEDNIFQDALAAYRLGDMKLVEGKLNDLDDNWCVPSSSDHINCTHAFENDAGNTLGASSTSSAWRVWVVKWVSKATEKIIRSLEVFFGEARFDSLRIVLTHVASHQLKSSLAAPTAKHQVWLFNLTADPNETTNLANDPQHSEVIELIRSRIADIVRNKPVQQKYWYQLHMDEHWPQTFAKGDCSKNGRIEPEHCLFAHPWIPDDDADAVSLSSPGVVDGLAFVRASLRRTFWKIVQSIVLALAVMIVALFAVNSSYFSQRTEKGPALEEPPATPISD